MQRANQADISDIGFISKVDANYRKLNPFRLPCIKQCFFHSIGLRSNAVQQYRIDIGAANAALFDGVLGARLFVIDHIGGWKNLISRTACWLQARQHAQRSAATVHGCMQIAQLQRIDFNFCVDFSNLLNRRVDKLVWARCSLRASLVLVKGCLIVALPRLTA